jgi:hypothetical protein
MSNLSEVMAQDSLTYVMDSVSVKKGSYFILEDEIILVKKDTVFVFVDTMTYTLSNTDDEKFYRELEKMAAKREWSKKLYDFLIIEPGNESRSLKRSNLYIATRRINKYRNKVIRDINFRQLMLFGPTLDDTTRTPSLIFEKIGNKLHTTTKAKVIDDNLLLEKGDRLNLENIQDAERILRNLPFIKDVRILPVDSLSSGDSVTLQVLTQDVFAYSFGMDFYGINGGALEVSYNNFLGLGHQLKNRIRYNGNFPKGKFGYGVTYGIPNIRRTFINAEANLIRNYDFHLTNIAIQREFLSPQIKYAGGIDVGKRFNRQRFYVPGEEFEIDTMVSNLHYQNLWLGRSFNFNFGESEFRDRSRLILAGRYLRKTFSERPEVTEDINRDFQEGSLVLGSLSFSTRHYLRDRLVYSYGRTEDIPYGQKITLMGGYEKNEFTDRTFASLNLSMARFFPVFGYLYAEILLESFYRNGESEQGLVRPTINYISNLNRWRSFRVRNFLTIEFTRGINRFRNEFLIINNASGIRGFRSHMIFGNQRLNINYELVAFSPADIVGFRIAPYFFYDASILAQNNDSIFKGNYYQGFGLGVRLRNDNLTFNAIEMRLGYYPNGPADVGSSGFNISELSRKPFKDFDVTAPDITPFQ